MDNRPVVIFGAGATKECGGPLTNEILPDAFSRRRTLGRTRELRLIERFLQDWYDRADGAAQQVGDHLPPITLMLSVLDTAIARDHSFGEAWDHQRLEEIRDSVEDIIYTVIDRKLRRPRTKPYRDLLSWLAEDALVPERGAGALPFEPTIITLNYDMLADNVMLYMKDRLPDYSVDFSTPEYRLQPKFGRLLKVHGSLNWLYCASCHRIDFHTAVSSTKRPRWWKGPAGGETKIISGGRLIHHYRQTRCAGCGSRMRPVLVAPSQLKDYRNPHLARVWYEADRLLRQCTRAIFVGYSLPSEDLDVIYLLKRGLDHLKPGQITVVEYDPDQHRCLVDHPVGQRYRALFGDAIEWHTNGFAEWAQALRRSPRRPPPEHRSAPTGVAAR